MCHWVAEGVDYASKRGSPRRWKRLAARACGLALGKGNPLVKLLIQHSLKNSDTRFINQGVKPAANKYVKLQTLEMAPNYQDPSKNHTQRG